MRSAVGGFIEPWDHAGQKKVASASNAGRLVSSCCNARISDSPHRPKPRGALAHTATLTRVRFHLGLLFGLLSAIIGRCRIYVFRVPRKRNLVNNCENLRSYKLRLRDHTGTGLWTRMKTMNTKPVAAAARRLNCSRCKSSRRRCLLMTPSGNSKRERRG